MTEYFPADPQDTEIDRIRGEVNFYVMDLETESDVQSIYLTLEFEQILGLAEQIKAGNS